MNNYNKGKFAELIARIYMRLHGYDIVCKNYITNHCSPAGEIDFIAKRKSTLVFVEVKRRNQLSTASYAINSRQRQRIIYGAKHYLQHHRQYSKYDIRFDAILITPPFHLQHIINAWQA